MQTYLFCWRESLVWRDLPSTQGKIPYSIVYPLWGLPPPEIPIPYSSHIPNEYPPWGPQEHIPFSILMQSWCLSSLGSPRFPGTISLFNVYSKLIHTLSGVSLPPKYIFLKQFPYKKDEYPLWGLPPLQVHIPDPILTQNWWISAFGSPSSQSTYALFNSYSKLMNILSGVSRLPKYIFRTQFLFKTDEHPLWAPVHIPYSILHPLWGPPPPQVHIP